MRDGLRLEHVPFGLVLGEDGRKLRTRAGETVRLAALLEEVRLWKRQSEIPVLGSG